MRKLSCAQVKRIIGSGRREDWPDGVREAVERHLASCADCRRELAVVEMLATAMSRARREAAPAGLTGAVMKRVSQREAGRARGQPVSVSWKPAMAVALVLVVALAAVYLVPRLGPGTGAGDIATIGTAKTVGAGVSAGEDVAFLEELVHYHQELAQATIALDGGVLLANDRL